MTFWCNVIADQPNDNPNQDDEGVIDNFAHSVAA